MLLLLGLDTYCGKKDTIHNGLQFAFNEAISFKETKSLNNKEQKEAVSGD